MSAPAKSANGAARFRVLIVDDHPIMRLGIAAIINAQKDMKVCAQAGSGEDAVRLFRQHAPDVTLMDLRLPGMSGLEALRAIRQEAPQARCVVLTTYAGDEDIHQALAAGAAGYLIKAMSHDTLVDALRKVHAGIRFLPAPVSESLARAPPTPTSALASAKSSPSWSTAKATRTSPPPWE